MAKIHITVPHTLSKTEAQTRIKKLLQETKNTYKDIITNITEKWEDMTGEFNFSVKGNNVNGTIEVHQKDVVINGEIPWTLSLFKTKIEKIIKEKASELLK